MKFFNVLMAAILLLVSGSVYSGQKANKSSLTKSISGSVFVVTNGQNTIKLALVTVDAIPKEEFNKYMRSRYQAVLEFKKNQLQLIEKFRNEQIASIDQSRDKFSDKPEDVRNQWARDCDFHAASVATSVKELTAQVNHITKGGKLYFEGMPTPTSSTKTDADGKFTLTLPAGKYVVAAKSSRQVVGESEFYHWLVWVDTSSTNNSLMLSNDNLFETGCNECVQPEKFSE